MRSQIPSMYKMESDKEQFLPMSPKFKRVSLNKILEFPFWGLNIYVDFDLRNSKKMENIIKLKKIIFHNKNIDIHKTA